MKSANVTSLFFNCTEASSQKGFFSGGTGEISRITESLNSKSLSKTELSLQTYQHRLQVFVKKRKQCSTPPPKSAKQACLPNDALM